MALPTGRAPREGDMQDFEELDKARPSDRGETVGLHLIGHTYDVEHDPMRSICTVIVSACSDRVFSDGTATLHMEEVERREIRAGDYYDEMKRIRAEYGPDCF